MRTHVFFHVRATTPTDHEPALIKVGEKPSLNNGFNPYLRVPALNFKGFSLYLRTKDLE